MKSYSVKIIECGDYLQLYKYSNLKIKKFDEDGLSKGGGYSRREGEGSIEYKNLVRSKNNMARLVMANFDTFKTFITLTFEENITDIKKAHSMFNDWASYLKKSINDFSYIAVPEFQKRGAIHYHLLTNINYTDFSVLCKEEKKLYSPTTKTWEVGRPVLSWTKGHSLAKDLFSDGIDLIGYLCKYMLKDFDDRLFGKRRYLYSRNLKKPREVYLNLNETEDIEKYNKMLYNHHIKYEGTYSYMLTGEEVHFIELKKLSTSDPKSPTSHNTYYVNFYI